MLRRSFAATPSQPATHHLLFARILLDTGDPPGAERQARQALAGEPTLTAARETLARALMRRAVTLHEQGRPSLAIPLYEEALALAPSDADAWNRFGVALTDAGQLARARAAYGRALALRPDYWQVEDNVLVHLHYDADIDPGALFEAHRDWARRHAASIARIALPPRPPNARQRIGFLSPAWTAGPVSAFVRPLLENLDRARFEPIVFNVGGRDATSESLRALAAGWVDLAGASDDVVADRIVAERIDVLVDLAGHTPGGRPLVLARKPAPRIVTWLDYFDTTGLDAVDVIVGDDISTPAGGPQRFAERVVRIDPCRLCYAAPANAPEVVAPPMQRRGHATFGSFNRYAKITAPVVAWWARVLAANPGSRLVIKNTALDDPGCRAALLESFGRHGIDAVRLEPRGPSPHVAMLAEYGDIDVALDTFPYNGGLTTCEALWMGVPVVAVMGNAMISRQSAALLGAMGAASWVGRDEAEAAAIAGGLVADASRLAAIRASLRERMRASPLMDGARFARAFERGALPL